MHRKAERLAPGMHNLASTLWPAWPVLLGLGFLTSSQFTHVARLGLCMPASAPHLLKARGEQTRGPHASTLLAERMDIWLQWG